MPRVSEEHLTARRRQILDAAQRCFGRTGFHRTSMQDILAEADLSAGAVYRYFKGKNDIMMAIAEEVITGILGDVGPRLRADPPPPVPALLATVLAEVEPHAAPGGMLRIAVQVWGEAMHDVALADFVARTYGRIREIFVDYARRLDAVGGLPAGADPADVGSAVFAMIPGYILQRVLTGGPDLDSYLAGVTSLLAPPRSGT